MTKVQVQFDLTKPLEGRELEAVANAHGYYGFYFVRLQPSMKSILVEYDASRLTDAEVEATLHRAGVPVQRKFTHQI
jgi:hypothetical protein